MLFSAVFFNHSLSLTCIQVFGGEVTAPIYEYWHFSLAIPVINSPAHICLFKVHNRNTRKRCEGHVHKVSGQLPWGKLHPGCGQGLI